MWSKIEVIAEEGGKVYKFSSKLVTEDFLAKVSLSELCLAVKTLESEITNWGGTGSEIMSFTIYFNDIELGITSAKVKVGSDEFTLNVELTNLPSETEVEKTDIFLVK